VLLVSQVITYFFLFLTAMYSARYLGAANFGILSLATAITSFFSVFGDLGLQTLAIREIAKDKSSAPRYIANVNLMRLIFSSAAFILIIVFTHIMGYPQQTIHVVYILWSATVIQLFSLLYYSVFQANERMELVAAGQITNSLVTLAGVLLAINFNLDLIGFAFVYVISNTVVLLYCIALTLPFPHTSFRYYTAGVFRFDKVFWKSTLTESWPFALQSFFVMVYYYIDTIILSKTSGDEVVGWYNAAYKLSSVPLFINVAFNATLLPLMSRLSISSPEILKTTFSRYFKYMMLLSIPIGVGTVMLSGRFITQIYGPGFTAATTALQVLIWATVFIFLNGCYTPLLYSLNKQVLGTKITLIAAIFNLVLNIILIPMFSYLAASYVKSITELLVLVIAYPLTLKLGYALSLKSVGMDFLKIALSSAIMGVFIWYFTDLNLLLLVPAAALIYFAASFLLRFYDRHDIDSVMQIISLVTGRNSERGAQ